MGRARNSASARSDAFAAVFGTTRGQRRVELKDVPSKFVRVELEMLLKDVAQDSLLEPMRVLRRESIQDLQEHPLLQTLVDAIAQRVCQREAKARTEVVRSALELIGIASTYSPRIVVWKRGKHTRLHVWLEGWQREDGRGPRSFGMQRTVCGRDMTGNVWERAQRGDWAEVRATTHLKSAPTSVHTTSLCEACEADLGISDFTERADFRFYDVERTLLDIEGERANAAVIAAAVENKDVEEEIARAWQQHLLTSLSAYAHEEGAHTLVNLLDWQTAQGLTGATPLTPSSYDEWARALSVEDWRELLVLDAADYENVEASFPILKKMTDQQTYFWEMKFSREILCEKVAARIDRNCKRLRVRS